MNQHSKAFQGKHSVLTEKIIGCFYAVYNELGYGFSEKVYENALMIALKEMALDVNQQLPVMVYFKGQSIGEYIPDLVVENMVLCELKSTKNIAEQHEAQLLNYLKATEIEVGLLLDFGPKAEFRRKVLDNERKGSLSWINPTKIP